MRAVTTPIMVVAATEEARAEQVVLTMTEETREGPDLEHKT